MTPSRMQSRAALVAGIIILNTKSIILNKKSIIFNTKFINFDTNGHCLVEVSSFPI